MAPDEALIDEARARVGQGAAPGPASVPAPMLDIVLAPVTHPALGEIRIEDSLFAVGRAEAPFATYPAEVAAVLSRRHARIFSEDGAAYIADLGSKNGTTVNGAAVAQQPARLRDGDELRFGSALAYRVQLRPRAAAQPPACAPVVLTLTPERGDLGLQPVEITGFPFLVSKADQTFARYREVYPHQVNYVSRRHAHIFLKGGQPFVEDLGSTNGTFVNGTRVEEHAVALAGNDLLAFGGNHFVYRVGMRSEPAPDATVTSSALPAPPDVSAGPPAAHAAAPEPPPAADAPMPMPMPAQDPDKTTFVAAPGSFLDIFCVDYAAQQEDEVNQEAVPQPEPGGAADKPRAQGRYALVMARLAGSFGAGERAQLRRAARWGAAVALAAVALLLVLYFRGAPEREMKALMASGNFARAAAVADAYLARHPDNAQFRAAGTEALLRAYVPAWMGKLQARDFGGADAALAQMKTLGAHNADARALLDELAWLGRLDRFVAGRGGVEAPIRMYADEASIRGLLRDWNADVPAHQRALDRISAYVPAFKDRYAEALSYVRKLQSDDSVYLAAIDRLNASLATGLAGDAPQALQSVLADYAEKYPRLAGMDSLKEDLRRYLELDAALRAMALGPVVAQMAGAGFATPPFQARYRELAASRLPAPEVARLYGDADKAWRAGDAAATFTALQQIKSGPWAEAAAKELARRQAVAAQFGELQKGRGGNGYDERLLSFYAMLDPSQDGYFVKAIEPDVAAIHDTALRRAQALMNGALASWRQYRRDGAIGGEQRLEPEISAKFRAQARLLSGASAQARQGMRIYGQLKVGDTAQWSQVRDDIEAEAELQRRSLQELRMVLNPAVLKGKLALIGAEGAGGGAGAGAGVNAGVSAGAGNEGR
ncbi:FHA domain-containing protein [Cupriavidus sp. 30B13]|uniref:FHA domain-containing protein n=1 Tax=Cupriavidus sp. 30B13 TaxID=3384241 RepID=UPI003B8FB120